MFLWRSKKISLGDAGEKIAAKYLKRKGYKILELNFCNSKGRRLGEIDIIARVDGVIVFAEVKTRKLSNSSDVLPEESINRKKLHKLNKIANFYLRKNNLLNSNYRFDAVSVWVDEGGKNAKVKHMESIFL
jgi:putative endonuclease